MSEYIIKKNPDLIDRKVIEDIKAEIEQAKEQAEIQFGHPLGFDKISTYDKCLDIISKHIGKDN